MLDHSTPPPLDGDFFQLPADQGEALAVAAIPKGPTLVHHRLLPGGAVPPFNGGQKGNGSQIPLTTNDTMAAVAAATAQ